MLGYLLAEGEHRKHPLTRKTLSGRGLERAGALGAQGREKGLSSADTINYSFIPTLNTNLSKMRELL